MLLDIRKTYVKERTLNMCYSIRAFTIPETYIYHMLKKNVSRMLHFFHCIIYNLPRSRNF